MIGPEEFAKNLVHLARLPEVDADERTMTIREVVVAHFKPTAAAGAVFQLVDAVEVITFLAIALNEIIRDVREGQGVRE